MTARLLGTGINAGSVGMPRIVAGKGVRFVLEDGREVLDGSNTGCPLGHGHPVMVEAVREAAEYPVVSEGWLWVDRERAAQELVETAFAGEDWVGGVRFCLSGSEANDLALSLAQTLTGRSRITTRERAYHGLTGLARDVTVQPHWNGGLSSAEAAAPAPRGAQVSQLPASRLARVGVGVGADAVPEGFAAAAEGARGSAAYIVDYSQGGIYHTPEYSSAVTAAARADGALWIADEVVTGFGRTGTPFGFQRGAERPDIVTLGKPLAGGANAAGAVVVSKDVAAQLAGRAWQTYSTFRGHPLTVAAIRAHLRVQATSGLADHAAALDASVLERMQRIAERHPSVERIDGRGLHWTVEFAGHDTWRDWTGVGRAEPLATRVAARALEIGAAVGTSGERTSMFIAPPLVMEEGDVMRLLDVVDEALEVADAEVAA